jgi:hypothetical protein
LHKGEEIFNDIKAILLAIDQEDRNATDNEINERRLDAYQSLFGLLDCVFALARTPSHQVTDDLIQDLRKIVELTIERWRFLDFSMKLPEIHILEDHLADQMERLNGIAEFPEDFVVLIMHQVVKKFESRSKMLDRKKAAMYQSAIEHLMKLPEVEEARQNVWKATARNFKNRAVVVGVDAQHRAARQQGRLALIATESERDPLPAPLVKSAELNRIDHLNEQTAVE